MILYLLIGRKKRDRSFREEDRLLSLIEEIYGK